MTRGGYITLIVIIVSLFLYSDYSKNARLDKYEEIILSKLTDSIEKDTVSNEILILKDSISEIGTILHSASKNKDTIIKNTYVKNIFVVPENENKTFDQIIDPVPISLTKSD